MQVADQSPPSSRPSPLRTIDYPRPTVPDGIVARPATDADLPAIRELVTSERHMSRSGLDDATRFTVVQDANGALLGAAQVKPAGPGGVELASRIVTPQARGQNLGKLLLWERLNQLAGPDGIVDAAAGGIYLRTRPQYAHTYEPLGFRELSVREAPRTTMMRLTALAGKLGIPAAVMGLDPGVRIDLGTAADAVAGASRSAA